MAYSETIRIATGHYRVRTNSYEVKELGQGSWQLLDPEGEEVGIYADKKQAMAASYRRTRAQGGGLVTSRTMPPSQPRNIQELAAVLTAIRKPAEGHHYVVLEVADRLTR